MPIPRWMAHINKRVFNRLELKRGSRPVLTHVGRSTGTTYRTPLDAHRVEGGYLFFVMYGSGSDWVRNVLAAGTARLRVGGEEYDLVAPRLVSREVAWQQLPAGTKAPPGFLRITDFLRMDLRT